MPILREFFKEALTRALPESILINGSRPQDPEVFDDRFYDAVGFRGTLGLGEAYVNGWWSCAELDLFFQNAFSANLFERFRYHPTMLWLRAKERLRNGQSKSHATEVIEEHYDAGNDIILSFLGEHPAYSCGYWKRCDNLDTAQEHKFELICKKLELKPGEKVLDIGCGYGAFAEYAAKYCGCYVAGITLSRRQAEYAKKLCANLPVDILLRDYRDLRGETFDKIVSIGMFEHVGYKNYCAFFESAERLLNPDGIFLLHTIGKGSERIVAEEPWIIKNIFPNGMLPTLQRVVDATKDSFDLVDMHEFGQYYDPTLMAWRKNFDAHWAVSGLDRDTAEYRKWYYYLSSCAALFRARRINLWQFVFRKAGGFPYVSVR